MNTLARSIMGMALTAGAMYLMDPVSGHRRRVLLRDQGARAARHFDFETRDARHEVFESAHALGSLVGTLFTRPASNGSVRRHARKSIRHAVSQPAAVAVAVDNGHVILRGSVCPQEHQQLLDEVRAVPGVRVVTDHLDEHYANGEDSLDASHEFRTAAGPSGWVITGRVVALCAGGALLYWGVRERKSLSAAGTSVGRTIWRFSREEFDKGLAAAKRAIKQTADMLEEAAKEAQEKVAATAEEAVGEAEDAVKSMREAASAAYAQADRQQAEVREASRRAATL